MKSFPTGIRMKMPEICGSATTRKLPSDSLLAEVPRHVRLPEAVQVEEALGETLGRRHISAAAAVGEGVAAAQTEPVAEILVQLRVCG